MATMQNREVEEASMEDVAVETATYSIWPK